VFQGKFLVLPTNALPEWLTGEASWTDWSSIPAFVDIVKIMYFLLDSKTQQIV
jgi:hypothetical protein